MQNLCLCPLNVGTSAWLLSAEASARCWGGAVGPEGNRCQENIACSEGRAGSTVMFAEEVVNKG